MSRHRAYAYVGQVWDLEGTIILVLGPGMRDDYARCLTLYDPDDNVMNDDLVGDWTLRWFDKDQRYPTTRLA